MTGIALVFLATLTVIFIVATIVSDDGEAAAVLGGISLVLTLVFVLAIPTTRLNTKAKVLEIEAFRETLDNSRSQENAFDVFERAQVIKEINAYNKVIAEWKTKGDKWYLNKWYYHPSTQNVEFIK